MRLTEDDLDLADDQLAYFIDFADWPLYFCPLASTPSVLDPDDPTQPSMLLFTSTAEGLLSFAETKKLAGYLDSWVRHCEAMTESRESAESSNASVSADPSTTITDLTHEGPEPCTDERATS